MQIIINYCSPPTLCINRRNHCKGISCHNFYCRRNECFKRSSENPSRQRFDARQLQYRNPRTAFLCGTGHRPMLDLGPEKPVHLLDLSPHVRAHALCMNQSCVVDLQCYLFYVQFYFYRRKNKCTANKSVWVQYATKARAGLQGGVHYSCTVAGDAFLIKPFRFQT